MNLVHCIISCHYIQKIVPCGTNGLLLLSGFQTVVTLTLYRVIQHTVVSQSSTPIYVPNVIEIGEPFLWTDYPQGPLQVQGHVTQKVGQISKIRPDQIYILYCSLRISGHLPAPVVNGVWDRRTNSAIFGTSEPLWPWPWIGLYGIPSCVSHRPLSTYQNVTEIGRTFCGLTNCRDPSKFPLRSDIKGMELPSANILIPLERQLIALQLCRWVFSERELTFTFAICYRPSVCLSVTLVRPTQAVQIFRNISTAFGT